MNVLDPTENQRRVWIVFDIFEASTFYAVTASIHLGTGVKNFKVIFHIANFLQHLLISWLYSIHEAAQGLSTSPNGSAVGFVKVCHSWNSVFRPETATSLNVIATHALRHNQSGWICLTDVIIRVVNYFIMVRFGYIQTLSSQLF